MDAWKDAKEIERLLAQKESVTIHFHGREEARTIMDALCCHGYPTDGYTIDEDGTDIDSDSLPTCYITKRYDLNGVLREAINESAGGLLNDVRYYDGQERVVYISSYDFVGGRPGYYIIKRTYYSYDKATGKIDPYTHSQAGRERVFEQLKLVFNWENESCIVSPYQGE